MVDLVISGLVIPAAYNPPELRQFESASTVTAGQMLYLAASNGNKATLADSDTGTAAPAEAIGIACNDAGIGEPVGVAMFGNSVTFASAILTKGTVYYLSNTAGGICPVADLGSGDYVTLVGIATSTTVLKLYCIASGVTI